MKNKAYAKSLKTCSQTRACDPHNLYGDQALKRCTRRMQQLKEKTYLQNVVLSIIAIDEINAKPM